jgi:catechol 2,3-dioxygenase-like lactoylglutathione lyase family enzyme
MTDPTATNGPGRTVGFGHAGVQVSDLERSRSYYRDIIGLVELERLTRDEPYLSQVTGYDGVRLEIALLVEPATGVILELVEYPAGLGRPIDPATANPGTGHVCFIVDDVDAIHARDADRGALDRRAQRVLARPRWLPRRARATRTARRARGGWMTLAGCPATRDRATSVQWPART